MSLFTRSRGYDFVLLQTPDYRLSPVLLATYVREFSLIKSQILFKYPVSRNLFVFTKLGIQIGIQISLEDTSTGFSYTKTIRESGLPVMQRPCKEFDFSLSSICIVTNADPDSNVTIKKLSSLL